MATAEAKCSQCGKVHVRSKLELTFKRPDAIAALPEKERVSDAKESEDLCSLRSERFFVRAVLPLPVEGWEDPYRIGIWVEVQRSAFERILHLWEDPAQDKEPAFGATLANDIPSFPSTCGLPVYLKLTSSKTRPVVLIPKGEHPLHSEQCLGITSHRANEYSSYFA